MKNDIQQLVIVFVVAVLAFAVGSPAATAQDFPGPAPEHELLKKDVGQWEADLKMWMPGSEEPMASSGTETTKMMGDMWAISDFKGEFAGQAFTGQGVFGYDPSKKKYVGTWVDSMTPYLNTMEGTYDEKTDTLTWMTTGVDPMTGKPQKGKNVVQYKDENTRVFTMYMMGEDDELVKGLEIIYRRK